MNPHFSNSSRLQPPLVLGGLIPFFDLCSDALQCLLLRLLPLTRLLTLPMVLQA